MFEGSKKELKGEMWEEWALTCGRNGSSERKKHLLAEARNDAYDEFRGGGVVVELVAKGGAALGHVEFRVEGLRVHRLQVEASLDDGARGDGVRRREARERGGLLAGGVVRRGGGLHHRTGELELVVQREPRRRKLRLQHCASRRSVNGARRFRRFSLFRVATVGAKYST